MYHLTKQTVRAKLNSSHLSPMLSRGEGEAIFRAWHQHPTFTPTPGNIAICSLLHNISLRGEKQFFSFFFSASNHSTMKKGSAFSGCQGWGHWAFCASFTSQPGCQSNTHTHSHTHWTGRGHGYFSSVYYIETPWGTGACGYIMDLLGLDDTPRWYFCLEGSVNEDTELYMKHWSTCQTFTFPLQLSVELLYNTGKLTQLLRFYKSRVLFHTLVIRNNTRGK